MEDEFLTDQDLAGLQRSLALADLAFDTGEATPEDPGLLKLLIARFDYVKVQMHPERGPHKRPHFHIEYKRQYRASYTIDTFERIVGYMPRQYEDRILEWARSVRPQLARCWEHLMSGGKPFEKEIAPGDAP